MRSRRDVQALSSLEARLEREKQFNRKVAPHCVVLRIWGNAILILTDRALIVRFRP
jgi:hypothetical protein